MTGACAGFRADGILLVDKPGGMTSHDVVAAVRKLVRPQRVGHTGTLDPLATGLLILCLGKATRIASLLQAEYKRYRVGLLLGLTTDTQDIEGNLLERRPVGEIPVERIQKVARSFVGSIEQRPPAFSALKVSGVRAYRLARQKKEVLLKPRQVEIKRFEIEHVRLPVIEFLVECSTGTYVRTICSDFGKKLGVGGCMQSLRRLNVGAFSVDEAVSLDRLKEKQDVARKLLPLEQALAHVPKFICTENQAEHVQHGMRIAISNEQFSGASGAGEWKCAYSPDNRVLAIGKLGLEGEERFFQPKKVLSSS